MGIEVIDTEFGVCLSQRKYCLELIHEFGLLGCKPVKTPLEPNFVINGDGVDMKDVLLENITEYQKLIGKLIYLMMTRPDISYTVQTLSQYMHSPRKSHLVIALRVLRYLKGCPGKGIGVHRDTTVSLTAFADADWAKCLTSRRSVTGYCIFFGKNLISWKSKKQETVSRSSTESEYRALGSTACEIRWILKLFQDFKISSLMPVSLFCDNESAIKLALNPVFHEKTKHFEIEVHFLRDYVSKGIVKLVKIISDKQKADIFTKSLIAGQHSFLTQELGMIDPFER